MDGLGEYLKRARLEKGFTIDELQGLTKIQKRYLIAIEEDDLELLPGKFYARAFIKQYAEALGLKPEEVFSEFQDEVPVVQTDDEPVPYSRVRANSAVRMGDSSRWLQFLPKIVLGMFIVGAVLLIYFLFNMFDNGSGELNNTKPNDDSVIFEKTDKEKENAKKAKDNNTTGSGTKITDEGSDKNENDGTDTNTNPSLSLLKTVGKHTTYELRGTDSLKVRVEASGSTFLKIRNRNGGTVKFQGNLNAADTKEFDQSSDKEIFIYLTVVPNVKIYVNDQELPYPVSNEKTQMYTIKLVSDTEATGTNE